MKIRNIAILVFMTTALLLAGCRAAPIRNIDDMPTNIPAKRSAKDVKKAIILAGRQLGWVFKETKPDLLEGRLHLRDHVAVVDIPYTRKSYSIHYKSSLNLNYDPTDNSIHKNYNSWVRNLNNAIQVQLGALD